MIATRLSDVEFDRFQSLIYQESGIHLSQSKRALFAGRLGKRLRALQITEFHEYLQHVQRSSGELARMLDVVTTNETRFFREQRQFDHLRDRVLPQWLADAEEGLRRREVRVWSAGCSTGEEPYSLAMMMIAGLGAELGHPHPGHGSFQPRARHRRRRTVGDREVIPDPRGLPQGVHAAGTRIAAWKDESRPGDPLRHSLRATQSS